MSKFLNAIKEEQKGIELFEGREALKFKELVGKELTLSNIDLLSNITDNFTGEVKSVVVLGFEEYPNNFVYANAPVTNFLLEIAGDNFKDMKEEIKREKPHVEVKTLHNKKFNNDYCWLVIK